MLKDYFKKIVLQTIKYNSCGFEFDIDAYKTNILKIKENKNGKLN